MILDVSAVPPFGKNGFVLACPDTLEGVVVDPGDEVDDLLDPVRRRRITVKYILLTHAHLDHISGVGHAKAALDVPVGLHRADEFLYKAVVQQGVAFGFKVDPQPPVDFYLEDGGPWGFGRYAAWVRHTPGHSPGGVCLAVGSRTRGQDAGVGIRSSPEESAGPDPARWGPSDAACVDPRRAVQFPDDSRRPGPATAADDDRAGTAHEPVPHLIAGSRSASTSGAWPSVLACSGLISRSFTTSFTPPIWRTRSSPQSLAACVGAVPGDGHDRRLRVELEVEMCRCPTGRLP